MHPGPSAHRCSYQRHTFAPSACPLASQDPATFMGWTSQWLHRQWHINQYYITYNIVTVWNSNVLYITVYYDSFLYLQPYRVCAGLYYAIGWCAPCTLIRCFSSFFLQECILRFYSMHYSMYKRGNPSLDLWSMHANHLSEDCVIVNFQPQGGSACNCFTYHEMVLLSGTCKFVRQKERHSKNCCNCFKLN